MALLRLGVLASGGGSNLQAIIDSCNFGVLKDLAEVVVVISNKADAYSLERADNQGIPAVFIDNKNFQDRVSFCEEIILELNRHKIDLLCLAGFMLKLESNLVRAFSGRILNVHPALLPKFGGKGMYGHHVHEAVLKSGEAESGATVHFVDEEIDHGPAIMQGRVPVEKNDTVDLLAKRVLEVEHKIYPEAILIAIKQLSVK